MLTKMLFLEDSYLKECNAVVVSVKDQKYVVLDQTIFYPKGEVNRGILEKSSKTMKLTMWFMWENFQEKFLMRWIEQVLKKEIEFAVS